MLQKATQLWLAAQYLEEKFLLEESQVNWSDLQKLPPTSSAWRLACDYARGSYPQQYQSYLSGLKGQ